jgi:hypothetical protein
MAHTTSQFSVPSTGSVNNLQSNAGDFSGQNIASNGMITVNSTAVVGVVGGQNDLSGTVDHVGTSPGNGTNTNCMSPPCLTGHFQTTPYSQLPLTCNFPG